MTGRGRNNEECCNMINDERDEKKKSTGNQGKKLNGKTVKEKISKCKKGKKYITRKWSNSNENKKL